jgi:large subunit ribosomal protein L4
MSETSKENMSLQAGLFNQNGEQTGSLELMKTIFGVEIHHQLMTKALKRQLAHKRLGTASTLTRGFVAGGGSKPWPQKGTGNARQGTRRSPLWPGGGVIFGPHPRAYRIIMSVKERRRAIFSALSQKTAEGCLLVADIGGLEPKTKAMVAILQNLKLQGKVLVVVTPEEGGLVKASRNIPKVKPILFSNTNVFDVLNSDAIIFTPDALHKLEEMWGS